MEFRPADYTLLIVDDILSNVLLLKALLKQERYNFISASSGEEALDLIHAENPDLVLLDVMMPGMSGFEVAETLQKEERTHDLPIIFLTALGDTANLAEGFQKGASDYISKPFQKDELFSRVRYQLMLRDARNKIREQIEMRTAAAEKLLEINAKIESQLEQEPVSDLLKEQFMQIRILTKELTDGLE